MSLTSAMLVGFTGINANSVSVDTIGNNLANVNTTSFKSQRTNFETLFYETLSEGTAPNGQSGGTLPRQVGYGVGVASLQRDFGQGSFESTGRRSDLAINGNGFFVLAEVDAEQVFTRDGNFSLDAEQTLVAVSGRPVQVFAADSSGNISTDGDLSGLIIPLGSASQATATAQVVMDGRLDSATSVAAAGSVVISQPLTTAGGTPATASTVLTDLVDVNGLPLFTTDDTLTIQGTKGDITMTPSTFIVGTDGRTVGDLAQHLETALGIDPADQSGLNAGVTIADGTDFPAGTFVLRSNAGLINAVSLDAGSIVNADGVVTSPFSFSTAAEAVGGGVTTSFSVFDSLGNQVDVRVRLALESKTSTGSTWRFFAESVGDSDLSPLVGNGTITFDADGQFVGATGTNLTIDRAGTGAASPLSFTLDFSDLTGLASPDGSSVLLMAEQDGAPAGIMTDYAVDDQGVITAVFSNQKTQVLGQIALATFANVEGLVAMGGNAYSAGPGSGEVVIVAPRTGGSGAIASGQLEQSNVEIAREFINMITASTGVSVAGRVVRVADDLLQELLLIAR